MDLVPLPPRFAATRDALHRVAEQVLAPSRVAATGNEIALQATPGGFGTPDFPDGGSVRVEGAELVARDGGGEERRAPLTTLGAAAALAGLPAPAGGEHALEVDSAAARALAGFYAFADDVLRELRSERAPGSDPSPIRLWPEHFDLAFDLGSEAEGRRAGYGASPGDAEHDEPYLYVGPWKAPPEGPLWQAVGFTGAQLGYGELSAAADPRAAALAFLRGRRDALA